MKKKIGTLGYFLAPRDALSVRKVKKKKKNCINGHGA